MTLSHDEQAPSLEDQLVELESAVDVANESNFLPSGDFLKVEDNTHTSTPSGGRNFSRILVKIKEQRQVKTSATTTSTTTPTTIRPSAVRQLSGHFVSAASRHRSLPASRFDSNFFEQPASVKTERSSGNTVPAPQASPIPTVGGSTIDLATKTVYSTNNVAFRDTEDTLFRHEVIIKAF